MLHALKAHLRDAREKRWLHKEIILYAAAISDRNSHRNVQERHFADGSVRSFILAPELESLMLRSGRELAEPVILIDRMGLYLVWFKNNQMTFLEPRHLTLESMRLTMRALEASVDRINRRLHEQRHALWLLQSVKRLEAQRQRLYNTIVRDYRDSYQYNGRK